jgi:phage shock protein PspC (stress-responsive transcriptional regulator)
MTTREKFEVQSIAPRKLYQMPDEGVITGVVKGLSTYFDIDPKILRGAFILLFLLTKGAWGIVYIVLMVTIPVAKTHRDYARAHGFLSPRRF